MPLTFLYKNLINNVTSITENQSSPGWGTAFLYDGDINSVFRGIATAIGTTTVLFNFGSAVYMDSVVCVSNLILSGTMILRAGTISSVGNQAFGIPIDGLGTSHKFFDNNGYQYWRLDLYGTTAFGKHQINEIFLGKRLSIAEMPSYLLNNSIEEDTTELISERGQKWIYHNCEKEGWIFNFESVNATTENDLLLMYKFVRKNTQPFFMALDPDNNPNNIKYVRFKDNSFLSDEVTKNVFDLTMEIEEEI